MDLKVCVMIRMLPDSCHRPPLEEFVLQIEGGDDAVIPA